MELIVATQNKKKFQEIKDLLKDLNLKITSLLDYPDAPKIEEDGDSFEENAIKKAATIAMFTGKLTLGEDSGLEVDFLDKKPGIFSSRFSGEQGNDKKNNLKLLRLLRGVPLNKRTARYKCSIALADKHKLISVTQASCNGIIGTKPEGNFGFGYDPLFIPQGFKETFGRLDPKIKRKISHRARAIRKVKKSLLEYV